MPDDWSEHGPLPQGVFSLPPGLGFPRHFVAGLRAHYGHLPPEKWARIEIRVPSRRMQREIERILIEGPINLLPRIRLIEELAREPLATGLPPPSSRLREVFSLARLVEKWLESGEVGPERESALDLADRLLALLGEFEEDAISFGKLDEIEVDEHANYWQQTKRFLEIVAGYAEGQGGVPLTGGGRIRRVVEALAETWQASPPAHPLIVVGSTGSRGYSRRLMEAVTQLPRGAVVLPGVDHALPESVFDRLRDSRHLADHPQRTLAAFLGALKMSPGDLPLWCDGLERSTPRQRLVSLALRPAPVTDEWLREAPGLAKEIERASEGLTLLEAPDQVHEAAAIAVAIRKALEEGRNVALVTENRTLARRVSGMLESWEIRADDSAGVPLGLSPPGLLLRQVAEIMGRPVEAEPFLTLLKHPLVAHGGNGNGRGAHLDNVRALERYLRSPGSVEKVSPHLAPELLEGWIAWVEAKKGRAHRLGVQAPQAWVGWLKALLKQLAAPITDCPLGNVADHHRVLAEALVAGPAEGDASELWAKEAGRKAREFFEKFRRDCAAFGDGLATPYPLVLAHAMSGEAVREKGDTRPFVRIFGPREMREIETDLLILGSLNEGSWPSPPDFDPWLSRPMRQEVGLALPERRIGLAALDFQMALGHEHVLLTRAVRDEAAPTIASRWLMRLETLVRGCGPEGEAALRAMVARGNELLRLTEKFLAPRPSERVTPAPRPAPVVPLEARPRQLSVTQIKTLITDPYEIYARKVLRLERLDPLRREADALLEGNVLHKVLERLVWETRDGLPEDALDCFHNILEKESTAIAWPLARHVFRSKLGAIAEWFIAREIERREKGTPFALEADGSWQIELKDNSRFTLTGRADRIDRLRADGYGIYDYKRSSPPAGPQLEYDWQLQLEAIMVEEGAFEGVPACPVGEMVYIGVLGRKERAILPAETHRGKYEPPSVEEVREKIRTLLDNWRDPKRGYAARGRPTKSSGKRFWRREYDHLARFGEWTDSDEPEPIVVGMQDGGEAEE